MEIIETVEGKNRAWLRQGRGRMEQTTQDLPIPDLKFDREMHTKDWL